MCQQFVGLLTTTLAFPWFLDLGHISLPPGLRHIPTAGVCSFQPDVHLGLVFYWAGLHRYCLGPTCLGWEQTHFCSPFPTVSPASSAADSVFYGAGLPLLESSPDVINVVCQQFAVLLTSILIILWICLCVGLGADTFLLSLPSSVAYLSSGWQLLRTSPVLAFHPYWSAQALIGS